MLNPFFLGATYLVPHWCHFLSGRNGKPFSTRLAWAYTPNYPRAISPAPALWAADAPSRAHHRNLIGGTKVAPRPLTNIETLAVTGATGTYPPGRSSCVLWRVPRLTWSHSGWPRNTSRSSLPGNDEPSIRRPRRVASGHDTHLPGKILRRSRAKALRSSKGLARPQPKMMISVITTPVRWTRYWPRRFPGEVPHVAAIAVWLR